MALPSMAELRDILLLAAVGELEILFMEGADGVTLLIANSPPECAPGSRSIEMWASLRA
jgi:hypothetical protein